MSTARLDNVFLIGLMGVGKTTVGKRLARTLGFEFVDSDREIELQTGAAVALIFDVEGESGFRDRENRTIDALTRLSGLVLATGGGAVLRAENRAVMRERGFVVYLHAPIELLYQRTRHDRRRPLLNTADRRRRLEELQRERDPLYRQCADLIVDTERRTVREIVETIRDARARLLQPLAGDSTALPL